MSRYTKLRNKTLLIVVANCFLLAGCTATNPVGDDGKIDVTLNITLPKEGSLEKTTGVTEISRVVATVSTGASLADRKTLAQADLDIVGDINGFMKYVGLAGSHDFLVLDEKLLGTKCWVLNKILSNPLTRMISPHFMKQAEDCLAFVSAL